MHFIAWQDLSFEPAPVIYATLMESLVELIKLIENIISFYIYPWTATDTFCQKENKYYDCPFSEQHLHICAKFNNMVSFKGHRRRSIYHTKNSVPRGQILKCFCSPLKMVFCCICSPLKWYSLVFPAAISDVTNCHSHCLDTVVILITFLLSFQLLIGL